MAVEFSEYRAPRAVGLFSEPLPEHDGLCWPVCGVDGVGMPHGTGATPKRGHLVWGASGGAPADAVFVRVTDLGGLTDGGAPAFLWACSYDGRLFLHLGAAAPEPGSGVLPEAGEGFIGASDAAGMPVGDGTGRHAGPDVYVCGMDERDAYLKTADGRWRADASWDVLACVYYTVEWEQHPETAWTRRADVATVWLVCSGNVICFYTSVSRYIDGSLAVYRARNWAAFGSVVCQYGYDPEDEEAGVNAGGWQDVLGGVVPVDLGASSELRGLMNVAALPWQGGGGDAVFPADGMAEMDCGTLNCTVVDGEDGLPFGNASFLTDAGVYVCPRLHFTSGPAAYMGGARFTRSQVETVLYGADGAFSVVGGHYALANGVYGGTPGPLVEVVPGFNLLFNPWGVEGLGLHKRGTLDFARVDARDYMPPAVGAEWVRVAAATLDGPAGAVYLDIAGAEMDGCLLTASGSTEFM